MSIWEIKGQAVSIERVKPFLKETDSIRYRITSCEKIIRKIKNDLSEETKQGEPMLRLSELTFAYDSNPKVNVFNKLNFEVKKGDKTVIRGRSGVGKTTLYKLLTSTYPNIVSTVDSSFFVAFSPQHPLVLPDTLTVQ
jgi:ABC-type multidrug transport system fused ATPase/permease subunit